jgi:hypothetical protein
MRRSKNTLPKTKFTLAQFHPREFCAMTGAEMGCERMLRPLALPLPWLSRLLLPAAWDMLWRPDIQAGS